MTTHKADVLIIGGGSIGLNSAYSLSKLDDFFRRAYPPPVLFSAQGFGGFHLA